MRTTDSTDFYPRFVEKEIREALSDTRIVLVCGPRQSGKTTLVRKIAGNQIPFYSLDDPTTLEFAKNDPVGFVRNVDCVVIDEVHLARNLISAIKVSVDNDRRPGRFLLTGSANLFSLPWLADSLAGRMAIVNLYPLGQAEIRRTRPNFLNSIFSMQLPYIKSEVYGQELIRIVLAGGFPEAVNRERANRREAWHRDYAHAIVQRDVRDIARIDRHSLMPQLLSVLTGYSGKLVNYSTIGSLIDANHVTTQKYMQILENLFVIHTLQSWHSNRIKRTSKSRKLHFVDSGLMASLAGLSDYQLERNRTEFGTLLESFVCGELIKLASWEESAYRFSHFRDRDYHEVDIVIEDSNGFVVGIEVKASATLNSSDFSGLRHLASICGDKFTMGLILCDHEQTVSFGERMAAVPVSALWS